MQPSNERSFILLILLLPFLILISLLLFIFSSSSPPPMIESQYAPSRSPFILVAEQPKEEDSTTTKRQRQRQMATKNNNNNNNNSAFIAHQNYHGTSSSSSELVAYQAQRGSFIAPRQNYDGGTSSHGTSSCISTGNSSFQSNAIRQAQVSAFSKNPRHTYYGSSTTSSSPFPVNGSQYHHHHGAAPGRTTRFQNIPFTKYYYNSNNNNNNIEINNSKTMIIPPPAKNEEEDEDFQFPKMLDMYPALPPLSIFPPSFLQKEENRTAQDITTTTRALSLSRAPQKYILPIITRAVPPTTTTPFFEHNPHFAAGMHAPRSSRRVNPSFVARG